MRMAFDNFAAHDSGTFGSDHRHRTVVRDMEKRRSLHWLYPLTEQGASNRPDLVKFHRKQPRVLGNNMSESKEYRATGKPHHKYASSAWTTLGSHRYDTSL